MQHNNIIKFPKSKLDWLDKETKWGDAHQLMLKLKKKWQILESKGYIRKITTKEEE